MTRLSLRALLPLGFTLVLIAGCGSSSSSGTTSTSTPAATSPTGTPAAAPTPPATPGKALPSPSIPATPVVTGSVAAVVNGHAVPISKYRLLLTLNHRSNPTQPLTVIETSVKRELIYDELVREYAVAHGIGVTSDEIAAREQQDAGSLGGEAGLQKLLSQRYGLTIAQYREIITPNLLAQKVEQQVAPVKGLLTDAQAKALAERLLSQLQHGADFATLARKYSQDPGSAQKGGDLGNVFPGQTVPPFDHAAFHAPLKTYVLVHSTFGYHIVEVLSRGQVTRPGLSHGPKSLGAHVRHILISTQASRAQQQVQQQQFLAWLQQQQKHASVKWVAKAQGG